MKEAWEKGHRVNGRPRVLKKVILAYLRRQHEEGAGHKQKLRPARIASWLQDSRFKCSHLHHISPYLARASPDAHPNQGNLHEVGRDTARIPPSFTRRVRSGFKSPAQVHPIDSMNFSETPRPSSEHSASSEPTRPKVGKNRRGQRSLQARVARAESTRSKKAFRRREYRHFKNRWKDLPREDPGEDLILGTLGPSNRTSQESTPEEHHKRRSPLPPPAENPSSSSSLEISSPITTSSGSSLSSSSSSSTSLSSSFISSSSSLSSSEPQPFSIPLKEEVPDHVKRANLEESELTQASAGLPRGDLEQQAATFAPFASQARGLGWQRRELQDEDRIQSFASLASLEDGAGGQRRELQEEDRIQSTASLTSWEDGEGWQRRELQGEDRIQSFASLTSMEDGAGWLRRELQTQTGTQPLQHRFSEPLASAAERQRRELQEVDRVACRVARAENALARNHRITNSRNPPIPVGSATSLEALQLESSNSSIQSHGIGTIFHHISLPRSGGNSQMTNEATSLLHLEKIKLNFCSFNVRGLKRSGRVQEISHLLKEHRIDFIGVQETKCSGNTLLKLAEGYLLNSSTNPLAGKEEHRGTGLAFRKYLAPSLRKVYQGSSRWCGGLFLAKPVPLLVLSVYAPTAVASREEKEQFYLDIGDIISENGGAMLLVLGDFNARLLLDPGLPRHVGRNILTSPQELGEHSEDVLENRDLFLDFLVQFDLVALNTLIPSPPERQITYRTPGQPTFTPPWDPERFSQIDFILTKSRWRNQFSNVIVHQEWEYDSDHLPVSAELHAKWYFGSPEKRASESKHARQTTKENINEYNRQLHEIPFHWNTVRDHLDRIAKNTRGQQQQQAKKPYLKEDTIELLRQRDLALRHNNQALSKRLTTQFRKQVKKDKKDHIIARLRTFTGRQHNWPAIKQLRREFIPRFSKRGHEKGVYPSQFPNDCGRYFALEHWKPQPTVMQAEKPPFFPECFEPGPFTREELDQAIEDLRINKAGGPDGLIMELIKDLDPTNRTKLLQLYNEIYAGEKIPDHFNEALVVQLYKPGKTPELYSSYRPIALLNVTYKILAKILQNRLREALDDRIVDYQYGYRRGRSTAEPIFIARRIQELAERSGQQLYILALDYSKAFDSIPQDKLLESLRRMGASTKQIALVKAIYQNPRFRIKIAEGISDEFVQATGIRQGCPLSPYLYIIATSCLMRDLLTDYSPTPDSLPDGAVYPTLLFADDTLLLTRTAKQMSTLLSLTIDHSLPYNLHLNKAKCQLLITNDLGCRVHFPDGEEVIKHQTIRYLGAIFSATLDVGMIVRQKITEANSTMRQLKYLWADTQVSIPWKLVVFNAVIRSKVFYTLETLELTQGHQQALDTMYFRGLRRILKKKSTFIDRAWTNNRLLELANRLSRKTPTAPTRHQNFSQYYRKKRRTLLAHLLRAPLRNLCRLSILTLEGEDLTELLNKKRVGRPRLTWLRETSREAWAAYSDEAFMQENFITLIDLATRRCSPPF